MARADRLHLISEIERLNGSYVISYVVSTRANLNNMMGMDAPRKIYEHLKVLSNKTGKIDLFLHSNGGDSVVPWRLVTLLREYCSELRILVPHRAFSAATLTCLGADKIIMHPMGMLGPTDPTVNGPFNPPNPLTTEQNIGISVEDVIAYIALIKEDAGVLHEEEFVQAFNRLTDKVHPLALGNVKRFLSQSRMLATKLLSLHMNAETESHKIDKIVDNLTAKLYFHSHPINRREARNDIGLLKVEDADAELERLMWSLYLEYENEMKFEEPFNFALEFSSQFAAGVLNANTGLTTTPESTIKATYVESVNRTDLNRTTYELTGQKLPNGSVNTAFIVKSQGWTTE